LGNYDLKKWFVEPNTPKKNILGHRDSMLLKFFLENKIQTRFPAFATIMTVNKIADKSSDRHSIAVHLDIIIR